MTYWQFHLVMGAGLAASAQLTSEFYDGRSIPIWRIAVLAALGPYLFFPTMAYVLGSIFSGRK